MPASVSGPVAFLPIAPVPSAGAAATVGSVGGARFGAVLDSVTPRNNRTPEHSRNSGERDERDRADDPRPAAEAGAAASAPAPAARSAPLATPEGDDPAPAGPGPVPAPAVVPATIVATPAPPSTMDDAAPVAAPSIVDANSDSSTMDAPTTTGGGERPAAGDTGPGSGSDPGSGRPHDSAAFAAVAPTARTDAATGTAAASQGSPVPQAPELPPAAQIALKLAPLRVGPDGAHQLTIHLNPEELGPVSVVARVRGDELSIQLTGSTQAGREALTEALPQLERELRDGGFNTLAVTVREAPRLEHAQRPAWAGGPGHSATDNATLGNGTTTGGGKTESQPIGQADQPEGFGQRHPARHDNFGPGMYNAAGQAVSPAGQAAGHQAGQHTAGQQPGNQLNLGQPGSNQPGAHQSNGTAEQHGNGQRHGTDHHGGPERLPGRPETGERNQHSFGDPAEHRPAADRARTRSVDLRV